MRWTMDSVGSRCQAALWLQVLLIFVAAIFCAKYTVEAKSKHGILKPKTRLSLRVNSFEGCPLPLNCVNIPMSRAVLTQDGSYAHDFDLDVKKEVPQTVSVVVKFVKCKDAVSSNTCEYFRTLKFESVDPCKTLLLKNSFWENYLKDAKPPITCPIKEGLYQKRNATVELDWFEAMGIPLTDIYIANISAYYQTNNKLYGCAIMQSTLFRSRVS